MFCQDRCADLRIGKRLQSVGNGGLRRDPAVGGGDHERISGGGEGEDRADRAGSDLRADGEAVGDHRVDLAVNAFPAIGCVVGLLYREGDAAAAGDGEAADQLELGGGEIIVGGQISV